MKLGSKLYRVAWGQTGNSERHNQRLQRVKQRDARKQTPQRA